MNVEQLTLWSDLLTAVAAAIAVAIGGIWTVYTFRVLKLKEKAQMELNLIQKRAEGMSVVDVKLNVEFLESQSRFECPIRITALVTNTGSRNTVLAFDDSPLIVQELLLQDGLYPHIMRSYAFPHLDHPHATDEKPVDVLTLRAGASDTFEFPIGIIRPGLYRASFSVRLSQSEQDVARSSGHIFGEEGLVWSADRVFHVPSTRVAPWTGAEIPGTQDRVVALMTDQAIKIWNRIIKLQDGASDNAELTAEELDNLLESILNFRSALIVRDRDTAMLLFDLLEDDFKEILAPKVLDEVRICIDEASEKIPS